MPPRTTHLARSLLRQGLALSVFGRLGRPCWWLAAAAAAPAATTYVVFGYNDLGMHCMNSDFSEIMVLPPFNTMHAQLLRAAALRTF